MVAKTAILTFPVVGICRNHLGALSSSSLCQKFQISRWNFDAMAFFPEVFFGFGGQIVISGYRSLSQSPGDCVFKLAVVDVPRCAVGISTLSVIVPEILAFPVRWRQCCFRLSIRVAFIWGTLNFRGRKVSLLR